MARRFWAKRKSGDAVVEGSPSRQMRGLPVQLKPDRGPRSFFLDLQATHLLVVIDQGVQERIEKVKGVVL
jgi:hypothetical protein